MDRLRFEDELDFFAVDVNDMSPHCHVASVSAWARARHLCQFRIKRTKGSGPP